MITMAQQNVTPATAEQAEQRGFGGRAGTLRGLTVQQFERAFGPRHCSGDGNNVTAQWFFNTPRGLVAVTDYWWNQRDELSISLRNGDRDNPFGDIRAARWLARFFRELGLNAAGRMGGGGER